ncbi:hypothetical protein WJX77_011588 [Trebouxia sp. C0004]
MKTFIGTVVSNKMVKSVLVSVARWKVFPKYKLRKRWTKKFMAHDEENKCNMGDTVRIDMSRPISKRKAWVVTEIIRRENVLNCYSHTNRRNNDGLHRMGTHFTYLDILTRIVVRT